MRATTTFLTSTRTLHPPSPEQTVFLQLPRPQARQASLAVTLSASTLQGYRFVTWMPKADMFPSKRSNPVQLPQAGPSKSTKSPKKPKPEAMRRHTSPKNQRRPSLASQRRRSAFDLFGDDEELQDAESKIGWCEICLKHCKVH